MKHRPRPAVVKKPVIHKPKSMYPAERLSRIEDMKFISQEINRVAVLLKRCGLR